MRCTLDGTVKYILKFFFDFEYILKFYILFGGITYAW